VQVAGLRLALPQSLVFDDIESVVNTALTRALTALATLGVQIEEIPLPQLKTLPELNRKGGLAPPEALAIHRDWLSEQPNAYDPRVRARILRGEEQDAADYIRLLRARTEFIRSLTDSLDDFDAIVMPTVPIVAPTIASLTDDAVYARTNMLALRNPSIINFLDGCAVSIPCHRHGDAPVGLMIAGLHGTDRRLLAISAAIEEVIARTR